MSGLTYREIGTLLSKKEAVSLHSSIDVGRSNTAPLVRKPLVGNFHVLQALRAIAAITVLIFHTNHSFFGLERYWTYRPFGSFFEFGHAGVEFFFVLSGFIIYMAHYRDIGQSERFKAFVWKRFRRVYPVYWVLFAVITPMYFVFPSLGTGIERSLGVIFDSTLLMHLFGDRGEILTVSWTLFHEVVFYGIFSILILNRTIGSIVLGAWMAISVGAIAYGPDIPVLLQFYVSPMHLLFGMGMCAAWLIGGRRVAFPSAILALGATLFLGTGMEEVYGHVLTLDTRTMLYGLGSVATLVGAIELERSGRIRVPRTLVLLGDASYSIYLVHLVVLSILAKLALKVVGAGTPASLAILYVAMCAAALGVGVLFHLMVEVPLLALMSRRRTVSRSVSAVPVAS